MGENSEWNTNRIVQEFLLSPKISDSTWIYIYYTHSSVSSNVASIKYHAIVLPFPLVSQTFFKFKFQT